MHRRPFFSFMALISLILFASSAFAQEGEVTITFLGIDACAFLSAALVIIFSIAAVRTFGLCRKLYGGRFTNALPYLFLTFVLMLGMQILCLAGDLVADIGTNLYFIHGIQVMQLIAGIFLILGIYQIYHTRFATEGFFAFEEPKRRGKNDR